MTSINMGGNNENDKVASPESIPIHHNVSSYTYKGDYCDLSPFSQEATLKGKEFALRELLLKEKNLLLERANSFL